jgi:hypothetical protein
MEDVAQLAFFEDRLVLPDSHAPFKLSFPGRSLISETEIVVIESQKAGRRLSFSKGSTTKIKETPAVVGFSLFFVRCIFFSSLKRRKPQMLVFTDVAILASKRGSTLRDHTYHALVPVFVLADITVGNLPIGIIGKGQGINSQSEV